MHFPPHPLALEPRRTRRLALLLLVFALFIAAITWQAARAPYVGDSDMVRIALMVLNRYDSDSFPGDLAMQSGTWWPGYIPVYLWLIGQGYQAVGDFMALMVGLTAVVYAVLLTGAYRLARALKLPFAIALAFALLCGLYVTTAHALSWTGLQIESAAGRNIYLALLLWLAALALRLWQRGAKPASWGLLGLGMGLLANLHPINGGTAVAIFGLMMLAGAAARRFSLAAALLYGALALPGLALAYTSTSAKFDQPLTPEAAQLAIEGLLFPSVYTSVARANLFIYRLPAWPPALIAYTLGLIAAGGALLYRVRAGSAAQLPRLWAVFGIVNLFGALLILLADWLVLFGGALWTERALRRRDDQADALALLWLAGVCALALTGAFVISDVLPSGASTVPFSIARTLQRSGTYAYGTVALLAALGLRDLLARASCDRWLLVSAAVAAVVVGFHEAIFETIPGTWLPLDTWIYAGVALLLAWPLLDRGGWRALRWGGTAALVVQALTRTLASPAAPAVTLLAAGIVAGAALLWLRASLLPPRRALAPATAALVAAAFLIPFDRQPTVVQIAQDARRVLLRDWSRQDRWSPYHRYYQVGAWLRQNTPPGTLVVAETTELRIWSLRPQVVGDADLDFLDPASGAIAAVSALIKRQAEAYQEPQRLLDFAREHGAAYAVVPLWLGVPRLPELTPVFETPDYAVYAVSGE
ncbi:MAG: hypothetical protein ACUVSX_02015 [Aggregatilineales bacterium]